MANHYYILTHGFILKYEYFILMNVLDFMFQIFTKYAYFLTRLILPQQLLNSMLLLTQQYIGMYELSLVK